MYQKLLPLPLVSHAVLPLGSLVVLAIALPEWISPWSSVFGRPNSLSLAMLLVECGDDPLHLLALSSGLNAL